MISRRPLTALAATLVVGFALASCDSLPEEGKIEGDLYEQLAGRRTFAAFADALDDAGEAGLLRPGSSPEGAVTVLAPTDIAFGYIGADLLGVLTSTGNREPLRRVLRSHVIPGRLGPDDFVDGDTLRSIDGTPLPVHRLGPAVRVGSATVNLNGAIEADGGIAYPLSDVLLGSLHTVERVAFSSSLARFRNAAFQTGMLDRAAELDRVTLLAPIDDAVAGLGRLGDRLFTVTSNADILRRAVAFHLVPGVPDLVDGGAITAIDGARLAVRSEGGVLTIGGRRVLREEVTADGRLLILGGVILAPLTAAERLRIEPETGQYVRDLREKVPDLWTRLQDPEAEVTVFAPTDIAFGSRGDAVNSALREEANAALNVRLLRAHVVEGTYAPEDLTDGLRLTAIDGTSLVIGRSGDLISVDGRTLRTPADVSNGHVYGVSSFFRPTVDAFDSAILRGYTQHARAVRVAGLESLFRTPGLTAFVATDSLYIENQFLFDAPDELERILRFTSTYESIPTLPNDGQIAFTAVDGSPRTVGVDFLPCEPNPSEPCPDPPLSFVRLDDGTEVGQGAPAEDGSGFLHIMDTTISGLNL